MEEQAVLVEEQPPTQRRTTRPRPVADNLVTSIADLTPRQ